MREVARFESAGDVRVMRVGSQESGAVLLEEIVAGKSCFIAYGESSHTARMIFDVAALEGLAAMLGRPGGDAAAALTEFASGEENTLVDLMDLCDERGVSYAYMGVGEYLGHSLPAGGVGTLAREQALIACRKATKRSSRRSLLICVVRRIGFEPMTP